MWDNFLFIGLPYMGILLFFGGLVYRGLGGVKGIHRRKWAWSARGDFSWTTRSTGFFGRSSIGPAALCIHWGILILFVAHLAGFIGSVMQLATWVEFFRWVGMFSGIVFLYGLVWAWVRRVAVPQLRAMSTREDFVILAFLIAIAGLGLHQSAVKLVFGVAYSVGPWLATLLKLQPDVSLIAGAPFINKLHVILAFAFFGYFPFTKLVHFFSFPLPYLWRPYISVRSYVGLRK